MEQIIASGITMDSALTIKYLQVQVLLQFSQLLALFLVLSPTGLTGKELLKLLVTKTAIKY